MALILPNQQLVLSAYALLVNETPGNIAYGEHQAFIAANGKTAYTSALDSIFTATSNAALATKMLAGLGLSAVFTQAQGEAYLAANSTNRVAAMLDLATQLVNYSGTDAALLAAKSAYVADLNASYAYSSAAANTNGADLDNIGNATNTNLELTAGTDRVTGTSAADYFKAYLSQNSTAGGVSNTLSSADSVNGGAGTDTLHAELVPEFYGSTGDNQIDVQPKTTSVEIAEFEAREFGSNSSLTKTVAVDAKWMTGINKIGSSYSDADLVIENLTTLTDAGVARNTEAITITMDHTDNFNTDEDASDLHVYFDDDYLLAGETSSSTLELRLVNAFELATNNTPLVAFTAVSFTVGSTLVVTPITAEMRALTGASAYGALVVAIQAQLTTLGITGVTVTSQPVRNVLFSDNVGSYVQGEIAGTYTPIQIVTDGATLTKGQAQLDNTTLDFNGLNTQTQASENSLLPITVNIDLDKVGRNGEGGDLIVGGKEQNNDNDSTQTSDTPGGITVFKVDVLGPVERPSNLGTMSSTNGELETVYISTEASYVAGGSYASLTIRDGFGEDNDDLKLVNADAFRGDLALGEETAVLNLDTLTAQGGGDVYFNALIDGAEENQAYSYTTGAGSDEVIVTVFGDALDFAQSSLDVMTGAGADTVTILSPMADNQDNQILNQVILQNINVDTGDGDDVVTLEAGSEGDTIIETGAGNDVIYTDGGSATAAVWAFNYDDARTAVSGALGNTSTANLPGVQTSLAYLAGATVTVTFSGAGLANAAGGGVMAVNDIDTDANVLADAFADGYESTVTIGNLINGNTYFGDQRDINAAIVKAINDDAVLSTLLVASISTNNTVVVRSLTSGAFAEDDLEVTLVQAVSGTAARAAAVLTEAETVFHNSLLTLGDLWSAAGVGATETYVGFDNGAGAFDTLTSQADLSLYYTGLGVDQATQHTGGTASGLETDNVINGGTGNDVIVLSTDSEAGTPPAFTLGSNNSMLNLASNETIVMEDVFGDDTVVNFTATDVTTAGTAATPRVIEYDFAGLSVAAVVGNGGTFTIGTETIILGDAGLTDAQIAAAVVAALGGTVDGWTVTPGTATSIVLTDANAVLTAPVVAAGADPIVFASGALADADPVVVTAGLPASVASGYGGIDFLDFGDYLTSTMSPSGSTASTVLIPVAMDNTVLDDQAATGVGANDVVVVRFDNTAEATETFAGLSASVIASLFNDQSGTTAVDYGNFADASFSALDNYDDTTPAPIDLVNGAAKAVVMVENADNLGEYKLFELSWYAGTSNGTSAHTVTAVEIGSLDFGTTVTGFTEVNLVGSVDYAAILANGINA